LLFFKNKNKNIFNVSTQKITPKNLLILNVSVYIYKTKGISSVFKSKNNIP